MANRWSARPLRISLRVENLRVAFLMLSIRYHLPGMLAADISYVARGQLLDYWKNEPSLIPSNFTHKKVGGGGGI